MYIRPLSVVLQQIAKSELNEVPERLQDDIKYVREWIKKQPHLDIDRDDQWIVNFLRSCKFSLAKTTSKLDFFFTIRSISTDSFDDKDPFSPSVQEILKRGIFIPVMSVEDGIPTKFIIQWHRADSKFTPFLDMIKVSLMFADIFINEFDNFTICGFELLENMKEFPLEYLSQFTPTACKKITTILQKAYPIRLKGVWLFHSSKSYDILISIFKPFITGKLKERVKTFGEAGLSGIYEPSVLASFPIEYGGKNGHIDEIAAEWKLKFENYRDWFLKDQELKSDESKRVGAPKTSADVLGVEGSFRKLAID